MSVGATPCPTASVIVRAKDKATTIGATLDSIARQSVRAEIVVVDSGSTDATVEIARSAADRVVQITPGEFSYGRALNIGAEAASGEILFALSAHCVLPRQDWVQIALAAYDDPQVAATIGDLRGPDGELLSGPARVTASDVRANPLWGFSNHASSWRRDVWDVQRFDEQVIACEDKEWMWRVLGAGFAMLADPRLDVPTVHRRQAGVRALFHRVYKENLVLAELADVPVPSLSGALTAWWSSFPYPSPRPPWQRRLSPWRSAELAGEYLGIRAGARRRTPVSIRIGDATAGRRR